MKLLPTLGAMSLVCLLAANSTAAKDPNAELKAMVAKYYELWSTKDSAKPAVLYAKEPDLVFYDIAPLKYTGWAQYQAGVQKGLFDVADSVKLSAGDDLKITRHGNLAWTSETGHLSAKMKDGKSLDVDFRHTAIWENRGGKRLIVHEHFSTPMP